MQIREMNNQCKLNHYNSHMRVCVLYRAYILNGEGSVWCAIKYYAMLKLRYNTNSGTERSRQG